MFQVDFPNSQIQLLDYELEKSESLKHSNSRYHLKYAAYQKYLRHIQGEKNLFLLSISLGVRQSIHFKHQDKKIHQKNQKKHSISS